MPKYDVSNSLGRGVDVSSLGFDTLHNPNASVLYDTTDSTYIYYQVVGDALLTTYAFEYTPLSNGNALVTSILVGSDSELISVVSGPQSR